ncbi:hypothetical protein IG631_04501 [Alternaria alternata]|nr:hypothetical protein IG631_04501 [Alternaria alternata]
MAQPVQEQLPMSNTIFPSSWLRHELHAPDGHRTVSLPTRIARHLHACIRRRGRCSAPELLSEMSTSLFGLRRSALTNRWTTIGDTVRRLRST